MEKETVIEIVNSGNNNYHLKIGNIHSGIRPTIIGLLEMAKMEILLYEDELADEQVMPIKTTSKYDA